MNSPNSSAFQPATQPAPDATETMKTCPLCSARLQEHRCKLLCPYCGFFLSCSDFY